VNSQSDLPDVPEDTSGKMKSAFKTYRRAMQIAERRAITAEKQQKFLAGKLAESKENEARTYSRLSAALDLLGQYRLMFRTQSEASSQLKAEDTE